ncbi:MAG: glutaredoxin family protein [Planctomycetaceae bacterium]
MDTLSSLSRRTTAALGTVGLLLGFLLAGVVLTVRLDADWGRIGSVIARNPVLCWGISVAFMLGGALLVKQASPVEPPWSPVLPGRRFRKAVLYTRRECPLCDEAVHTLEAFRQFLPTITRIDIDGDPAHRDRFKNCIPVLELDGRVRFRGHMSELLLRRLIEGTPPRSDHDA